MGEASPCCRARAASSAGSNSAAGPPGGAPLPAITGETGGRGLGGGACDSFRLPSEAWVAERRRHGRGGEGPPELLRRVREQQLGLLGRGGQQRAGGGAARGPGPGAVGGRLCEQEAAGPRRAVPQRDSAGLPLQPAQQADRLGAARRQGARGAGPRDPSPLTPKCLRCCLQDSVGPAASGKGQPWRSVWDWILLCRRRNSKSGSPTACRRPRPTPPRRSRRRQSWTWPSSGPTSTRTTATTPRRACGGRGCCPKGRRRWSRMMKKMSILLKSVK